MKATCIKDITNLVDGTIAKKGTNWNINSIDVTPKTYYCNEEKWYNMTCEETNVRLNIRSDVFGENFEMV